MRGTHCTTAEIVSAVAGEVLQSRTHMQEHMEDVDDEEEEDDDDDVF